MNNNETYVPSPGSCCWVNPRLQNKNSQGHIMLTGNPAYGFHDQLRQCEAEGHIVIHSWDENELAREYGHMSIHFTYASI